MNKKISKFLIGICAVISAGVISFIPAGSAQAAVQLNTASPVTNEIYILNTLDDRNFETIPGTVQWSYSGVSDLTIVSGRSQGVAFYNNISVGDIIPTYQQLGISIPSELSDSESINFVMASTFFHTAPGVATGTADYDFTYEGVHYSGTVELSQLLPIDLRRLIGIQLLLPEPPDTSAEEFRRSINDKVTEIELAVKGLNADGSIDETKTVEYNCKGAINYRIISALAKTEGVTLIYTFEYQGYVFTSTITSADAAKMYSPDIDWYGPCYIANNCPTALVGVVL